jgi:hypothetical protein
MVDRLGPPLLSVLRARLASVASEWPDLVTDVAAPISEAGGTLVLEVGVLEAYLTIDPESDSKAVVERVGHLLTALVAGSPRPHLLRTVLEALFERNAEAAYAAVNADRITTVQALKPDARNWLVLLCRSHLPARTGAHGRRCLTSQLRRRTRIPHRKSSGRFFRQLLRWQRRSLREGARLSVIAARCLDPDQGQPSAEAITLCLRAQRAPRQVATAVARLDGRRSKLVDRALQDWSLGSGSTDNRRAKANTTVALALLDQKRELGSRMSAISGGGLIDSQVIAAARTLLLDRRRALRMGSPTGTGACTGTRRAARPTRRCRRMAPDCRTLQGRD